MDTIIAPRFPASGRRARRRLAVPGVASRSSLLQSAGRANRRSCPISSIPGSPCCPTAASRPSSARWTWARVWTSRSRRSSRKNSTSPFERVTRLMGDTATHLQSGRRIRQHRRLARRLHAAQRRRRSTAHSRRARRTNGSASPRDRARVDNGVVIVPGLRAAARHLRRADRRPPFNSQVEWNKAVGNSTGREGARRKPKSPVALQDRRQVRSAA